MADKTHGLYLPYNSHDMDKGGNTALMAPEIVNAEPGPFTRLNYSKADLWAAGAIAYEIFGDKNPFYGEKGQKPLLMNHSYAESDLPPLPDNIPPVIAALIKNMLNRSLYKVCFDFCNRRVGITYLKCIFVSFLRRETVLRWLQQLSNFICGRRVPGYESTANYRPVMR